MNGSLHLGHGFTISKIEFATGFECVFLHWVWVDHSGTTGLADTSAPPAGA